MYLKFLYNLKCYLIKFEFFAVEIEIKSNKWILTYQECIFKIVDIW